MSNGVGLIAALAGSLPALPSPRPSDPPEPGSRRALDRVDLKPTRTRAAAPQTPPRFRAAEASVKGTRTRSIAPGSSAPKDPLPPGKPGGAKPAVSPLSASIDRVRIVSDTRLRISLKPAALGDVQIELRMAGSLLRARVRTASEEARALILARLEELRDILEGHGIRVKEFQVDVDSSEPAPERNNAVRGRGRAEDVREDGPRSHRRQVLDVRV